MEMVIMFQLLRVLFNPRPTLQEVIFALALVTIARRTIARMSISSVICLLGLPVPVILYVLDHGLWLEIGSGNANYMFFQCLAYNLFLGFFTLDFISSTLQRDKALQLTYKNSQSMSAGADEKKND
jgi:phosphatidylinositol glycan class U